MNASNIERFLDKEGKITVWPSKKAGQLFLLEYLSSKFSKGQSYSEKEVNEIIKAWHTFSDWSLLRREMYNYGFFDRDLDGSNYRLGRRSEDCSSGN